MLNKKIGIVGLGYVGLPLAVEFSKKYKVVGFDINIKRINELKKRIDTTLEVTTKELEIAIDNELKFTNNQENLSNLDFYIITVPTPIDNEKKPDLQPIIKASNLVGKYLNKNNIVIYESTVYPGLTEDVCVPILENKSKLKYNKDFFVGYSPERINPGDKQRTLTKIVKVTSGSNPDTAKIVDDLYSSIIDAGTYMASSIKVAEASKVIENSQRDINIAFVNELSKIFNLMDIDTLDVLEAAGTKWNFMNFKPGLVGGHCIGVDPYYLAEKALMLNYNPDVILSGRRINDSMASHVAEQITFMINKNKFAKILLLGLTFKENCPDIRNSQVLNVIKILKKEYKNLVLVDPLADLSVLKKQHNIECLSQIPNLKFDLISICVPHEYFYKIEYDNYLNKNGKIYDLKGILKKNESQKRL